MFKIGQAFESTLNSLYRIVSYVSTSKLQISKHADARQNLTQNGRFRSFQVTCFGVSGNAIKVYVIHCVPKNM